MSTHIHIHTDTVFYLFFSQIYGLFSTFQLLYIAVSSFLHNFPKFIERVNTELHLNSRINLINFPVAHCPFDTLVDCQGRVRIEHAGGLEGVSTCVAR